MGDGQSGRLSCQHQQSVMLWAIVYTLPFAKPRRTSEGLCVVTETWYGYKALEFRIRYVQKKRSGRKNKRHALTTKDSLADFYLWRR
ncbi:hypothetical protein K443DRAFT_684688, partial [Laccaria amethystina LaAM-08-1]